VEKNNRTKLNLTNDTRYEIQIQSNNRICAECDQRRVYKRYIQGGPKNGATLHFPKYLENY